MSDRNPTLGSESRQESVQEKIDFKNRSPATFRFHCIGTVPAALVRYLLIKPMPIWLIEILGARSLDKAFLLIALMTLPVWIGMIVFSKAKIVQKLAHPLLLPPVYSVVLFVLLWKFYRNSFLPEQVNEVSYDAAKDIVRHPAAFLALFCNFQIINLALGTFIFQKAKRCGFRAPVELLLCGLLGAPALIPFAARLIILKKPLS